MAVIDLQSGKITQDAPDIAGELPAVQDAQPKPGGVIDLDTGKFVQDVQAEKAEEPGVFERFIAPGVAPFSEAAAAVARSAVTVA